MYVAFGEKNASIFVFKLNDAKIAVL